MVDNSAHFPKGSVCYRCGSPKIFSPLNHREKGPVLACARCVVQSLPEDFCGNPSCMKRKADGATLKKCAACLVRYYCSKNCQAAAWKDGHKEECARIRMPWKFDEPYGGHGADTDGALAGLFNRMQHMEKLAKRTNTKRDSTGLRIYPPHNSMSVDEGPRPADEKEFLPPADNAGFADEIKVLFQIGNPKNYNKPETAKFRAYMKTAFAANVHTNEAFVRDLLRLVFNSAVLDLQSDAWWSQEWALVFIKHILTDRPASEHQPCLSVVRSQWSSLLKMLVLGVEIDQDEYMVTQFGEIVALVITEDDIAFIDEIAGYICDTKRNFYSRLRASGILAKVIQHGPQAPNFRKYCIDKLSIPLSHPRCLNESPYVVASIVCDALDAKIPEMREAVCHAYSLNCVDVDIVGGFGSYMHDMGFTPSEHELEVMKKSYRHHDPTFSVKDGWTKDPSAPEAIPFVRKEESDDE